MIRPIYLYGQGVLRKVAAEADLSEKEMLTTLLQDMWDTLAKADGCGLAAPQVGESLRVLIVDGDVVSDNYDYLKGFKRAMINPVVKAVSDETNVYSEGCLSVPGVYSDVRRPSSLTVEYYNENFEPVTETFDKFAARMVEHELEHLEGHVFVDNLAPIRRKMLDRKLQNITKGKVSTAYKVK
ncbi:MAG: peptide deformylase [Bacteroidales bacterium]|nr:peptide deformylase [Bacteroidales bacterium]